jgi:rhodanese-related sulfurtransferase/DNA-binding transcriptional ArsR family regulator
MPRESAQSLKAAVFEQVARIGGALSAPGRLELLDVLAQGPRTVEVLASQTGQSVANASHHLQVLRRARLVETEKSGLYVTYRLSDARVEAFLLQLRTLAEARLAEITVVTRQCLEALDALDPVAQDELVRRVRAGEVTLLDVRPSEEFAAGHIPGALSVPLASLPRALRRLPKRRTVVAYCRGPYCVMAVEAVRVLRKRGFQAHRLESGVPDWRARGWRIAKGRAADSDRPAPATRSHRR